MSSLRNAIQRRNHKERAQPVERSKWGLLEKRKDYKLRAADHRAKKAKLKALKEKAEMRNEDEFSFGMMSSRVDAKGRKVGDRGNRPLSEDVVRLLKTQDVGYLRTTLQTVRKKREQMEGKIVLEEDEEDEDGVGVGKMAKARALRDGEERREGRHTVYVGDREEQEGFDVDEWFGRGGEWPDKAGRKKGIGKEVEAEDDNEEQEHRAPSKKLSEKEKTMQLQAEYQKQRLLGKRHKSQMRMEKHLETLKARERDLTTALEELEQQRAKMANTVGGVNKNGVKFKIRERKR